MVYDLRQEGVHLAAGTVLRDEGLCDDARTEVGALFHHGHLPDDLRGAGDPGDAGAGRENFGEGTRVNDPSALVHGEDGRLVLALEAEVSVRVVLEDYQIVPLGDFEHLPAALRGERVAGGVLEVHDGVDEFDLPSRLASLLDRIGQQIDLHAVLVAGNGDESRSAVAHGVNGARISRVLHDDRVAGIDQRRTEEVHPLLRTGGDEKLVRFGGPAHARRHPTGDEGLQRFISVGCSVLEDLHAVPSEDDGRFRELRNREYHRIRIAAGEGYHARLFRVLHEFSDRRRPQVLRLDGKQLVPIDLAHVKSPPDFCLEEQTVRRANHIPFLRRGRGEVFRSFKRTFHSSINDRFCAISKRHFPSVSR